MATMSDNLQSRYLGLDELEFYMFFCVIPLAYYKVRKWVNK